MPRYAGIGSTASKKAKKICYEAETRKGIVFARMVQSRMPTRTIVVSDHCLPGARQESLVRGKEFDAVEMLEKMRKKARGVGLGRAIARNVPPRRTGRASKGWS